MRKRYIIAYDIREPKRLTRVYRKMRGYGDSIQYSVFICELSKKEKLILLSDLSEIINSSEDNVLIVELGQTGSSPDKRIETMGRKIKTQERVSIII